MKFTDQKAAEMLRKVRVPALTEDVETYPESERDGRTDIDILKDEVWYLVYCYHEEGHSLHDELQYARAILRETKNGKIIPLDPVTFRPKSFAYTPVGIRMAKDTVNEYKRLERLADRLDS